MRILLAFIPLCLGLFVLVALCDFDIIALENVITYLTPFDWHAVGVSFYCGAIIGWERMLSKKVLGMRTSIFIVLGTYIFTSISITVSEENAVADATRVIGQIVSGIGFLGAGVMFNRDNKVSGLTSAATIWMLAALGVCIGVGYLTTAVILSTLGVMLLLIISEIDDGIVSFTKSLATKPVKHWRVHQHYVLGGFMEYYIETRTGKFGFWKRSPESYSSYNDALQLCKELAGSSDIVEI
jgi:putative Mg2+ transporter-C (MgtC) family protein